MSALRTVRHLSVENVLAIHAHQIRVYGGADGLRARGLLESAVAMPQQSFGGVLMHEDVAAMAAAYWFHLAKNHAFVDGNKRVAAAAALLFLRLNTTKRLPTWQEGERVTMAVAASQLSKTELTEWLRKVLASG